VALLRCGLFIAIVLAIPLPVPFLANDKPWALLGVTRLNPSRGVAPVVSFKTLCFEFKIDVASYM